MSFFWRLDCFIAHVLNLVFFFNISFSFCVRNGYETISFGDDFMGHMQLVHSHLGCPIMWCLIRAYFCKKKRVIEEVSRPKSS